MEGIEVIEKIILLFGKIDWAISLLAAIPLAIVSNLLTPAVQNWLANRSDNKKQKRQDVLKKEIEHIRDLVDHTTKMHYETYIAIISVLMWITVGSVIVVFPIIDIFTSPIAAIFFLNATVLASKHIQVLKKCRDFDKYLNNVNIEMKKMDKE